MEQDKRNTSQTIDDLCGCHGKFGENGYCTLRELVKILGLFEKLASGRAYLSEAEHLHRDFIYSICGCNGKIAENGGCNLIEYMLRSGDFNERAIAQLKCLEIFKYERGISGEQDGWPAASRAWINGGHAAGFAQHYKEGTGAREVYSLMFPKIR